MNVSMFDEANFNNPICFVLMTVLHLFFYYEGPWWDGRTFCHGGIDWNWICDQVHGRNIGWLRDETWLMNGRQKHTHKSSYSICGVKIASFLIVKSDAIVDVNTKQLNSCITSGRPS